MSEKTTSFSQKQKYQKRKEFALRGALFLLVFILTTLVLVVEKDDLMGGHGYVEGEPARKTYFAPFDLTFVDEELTSVLREQAASQVDPVFQVNAELGQLVRQRVDKLFLDVHAYRQLVATVQPSEEGVESAVKLEELPPVPQLPLPEEASQFLIEEADLDNVRKDFEKLLEQRLQSYVLNDEVHKTLFLEGVRNIRIIEGDVETTTSLMDIPVFTDWANEVPSFMKGFITRSKKENQVVMELFRAIMTSNLKRDGAEEGKRKAIARAGVAPVEEQIQKNELLVQRGMIVEAKALLKLDAIQKTLVKQKMVFRLLGIGLMVFSVFVLGWIYMSLFEKKIFSSFKKTILIHSVILITILLSKLISFWPESSVYLMPLSLASILLTLLVNPRVALLCGTAVAVLISPIVNFQFDIILAALFSSTAGVFASYQVRKRIHFLRSGFAVGVTYFLVIFGFQVLDGESTNDALLLGLQGLANGVLITMPVAFLLLPLLEWIFDLVTDITLLEYSDLNHPLLKRMVVEAPGTYHHSLVVSTLSESACEAIGANALLARVGCYFHDIGKIARSEYFTENESMKGGGMHGKLTPTMSCLIIMNHVKEGIELGRKNKLRQPILDFIPEHQGTGIIYYFYRKATEQAAPGEHIDPNDFRYPGPRPQSKETAVALIADSVEAASRSLKEPTAESIRQLVRKIINDKFIDNQLDECNLTLKDLHLIQESFVQNLMAIFHTRVKYPQKNNDGDVDLFKGKVSSSES